MDDIQLSFFGRTCPEPSTPPGGQTSPPFSAAWLEERSQPHLTGGGTQVWQLAPKGKQPGAFSMLNTSAWPSDAAVSSLWEILEGEVPAKYYLSPKACAGILRRAERRGKALPTPLLLALQQVAGVLSEAETTGGKIPLSSRNGMSEISPVEPTAAA